MPGEVRAVSSAGPRPRRLGAMTNRSPETGRTPCSADCSPPLRSLDGRYVRGRAFNLPLLATAYATQGEPVHASIVGRQALNLTVRLTSARSVRYVRDLVRTRRPRADVPSVRDFTAEVRERLPAAVGQISQRRLPGSGPGEAAAGEGAEGVAGARDERGFRRSSLTPPVSCRGRWLPAEGRRPTVLIQAPGNAGA